MKIAIGCDHGALALKNKVVSHRPTREGQQEKSGKDAHRAAKGICTG